MVISSTKSNKNCPLIYGVRCVSDQSRKVPPDKVGLNRVKLYKIDEMLLCKILLKKPLSTNTSRFFQLSTHQNTVEIPYRNLPTVKIQGPTFVKFESNLKIFPSAMKWSTSTWAFETLFLILQSSSLWFAPRSWFYVNFWSFFQVDVFFRWHSAIHWWRENRNLCRFWLCFSFLPSSSHRGWTDQPKKEKLFHILRKTRTPPKQWSK